MVVNQRAFHHKPSRRQTTARTPFDFEWWVVSKRSIYKLIAVALFVLLTAGSGLYVWRYGNPFKKKIESATVAAGARFISFEGDVRVVRARTRETIVAHSDTQLYPGDTVQTQADGRALLSMIDGSTCLVRPNSVVTIRDNTSIDAGINGTRANVRVAIDRGQINVRTQEQVAGTNNVVETTQTESSLTENTNASFGVHDDRTAEIRVAAGNVKTVTNSGEKMVLSGGEYAAFNQQGNVSNREKLLPAPAPLAPHDLERLPVAGDNFARVVLRWQQPNFSGAKYYRVEVATSPFFVEASKVFERDQLEPTQLVINELRLGSYFWRVRATAASGQISEWSEPQKFFIVPDGKTDAKALVSNVTCDYVAGSIYLVRGKSPAGTRIKLAGRETIATNDDTFQIQVSLPKGTRFLQFDAEDMQGNRGTFRIAFNPNPGQT
jgi:hypothetical protein